MEVKPGYKQTEVGVIPEDWEVPFLRQHLLQDATYGVVKAGTFQRAGISMLRGGDIKNGSVAEDQPLITAEKSQEYSRTVLKELDVVIALVGYPGETAVIPQRLVGANISRAVGLLRPARTLRPDFLTSYLNSPNGRKEFLRPSAGSAQIVVNLGALNQLRLPLPLLPEQRAIAEALSDVDALLTSLARLLDKKRDLKQAAMQQLLTGQSRLPGFKGEWVDTTLGEVVTFTSGGTPSRSNDEYWNGEIPWISATSLRCFEIWRSPSNVTEEAVAAGSKFAPIDSTLMLVRGSALHNEILCGLVTKRVCFNQDVKALIPSSKVFPRFLTWLITGRADDFLKLVSSAGNTAGVLDTKQLKAFEFLLPSLPEQTAIAAVLTEMDAELAALEQRQAKTRALKQGMMQELLTGRTRMV